jgi:hypothetical protein
MPRKPLLSSIWVIPVAVLTIVGTTLLWVTYDKYQQVHEAEYRLLEAHARYAEVQLGVALHDGDALLNQMPRSGGPASTTQRAGFCDSLDTCVAFPR